MPDEPLADVLIGPEADDTVRENSPADRSARFVAQDMIGEIVATPQGRETYKDFDQARQGGAGQGAGGARPRGDGRRRDGLAAQPDRRGVAVQRLRGILSPVAQARRGGGLLCGGQRDEVPLHRGQRQRQVPLAGASGDGDDLRGGQVERDGAALTGPTGGSGPPVRLRVRGPARKGLGDRAAYRQAAAAAAAGRNLPVEDAGGPVVLDFGSVGDGADGPRQ